MYLNKVYLYVVIYSIFLILSVLISVAYFTLLDRKVMAAMQRRRGPNVVGFWGLLQPLADGAKLLLKESVVPVNSTTFIFILAPLVTFILSLLTWAIVPYTTSGALVDIELGLLVSLVISALSVYGIVLAGWSSNSKYAFLGAVRSTAQMISYEVSMGFILVSVVICTGSMNMYHIVVHQSVFLLWNCWYLWPQCILFFLSSIAETNRAPFDLAEAEAELVAGYFVEYSGMSFALFFLGEYSNMLVMCILTSILFLGGWWIVGLGIKVALLSFVFVWLRASFPRFRYDQLMQLGWKSFLPLSMALLVVVSSMLLSFNGLPHDLQNY